MTKGGERARMRVIVRSPGYVPARCVLTVKQLQDLFALTGRSSDSTVPTGANDPFAFHSVRGGALCVRAASGLADRLRLSPAVDGLCITPGGDRRHGTWKGAPSNSTAQTRAVRPYVRHHRAACRRGGVLARRDIYSRRRGSCVGIRLLLGRTPCAPSPPRGR